MATGTEFFSVGVGAEHLISKMVHLTQMRKKETDIESLETIGGTDGST